MKVNWRFKAKKVAFRERNRAKVENSTFCIPQSQKSRRDFSVLEGNISECGAESEFEGTFC